MRRPETLSRYLVAVIEHWRCYEALEFVAVVGYWCSYVALDLVGGSFVALLPALNSSIRGQLLIGTPIFQLMLMNYTSEAGF